MRLPNAIYLLKPELVDPRFDGFEFLSDDYPLEFKQAYQIFNTDGGRTIQWQPRKLGGPWKPLPVSVNVKPFIDYPCLNLIHLVFSHRALNALSEMLSATGILLPLDTGAGYYHGYICHTKIDALDLERSQLRRSTAEEIPQIDYFWFNAEKLDGASIFTIPERLPGYFVTDSFKKRVEESGLNGFCFIPVWPLPEGSRWEREEFARCRAREGKRIPLVGEAVVIRFRLAESVWDDSEMTSLTAIESMLRQRLNCPTAHDQYFGDFEFTETEEGEYRIYCSCPNSELLWDNLLDWFSDVEWPLGIGCLLREGNLYTGRAKHHYRELRSSLPSFQSDVWWKKKIPMPRERSHQRG